MICLKTIIRYDIVSIVIGLFIEEDECEDQGKDESKQMKINYKIAKLLATQSLKLHAIQLDPPSRHFIHSRWKKKTIAIRQP